MAEEKAKIDEQGEENPLNNEQSQTLYRNKNIREKLIYIRDNITVEPLLAGLIIPSVISMFTMINLNLDKACRVNLQLAEEICDGLLEKHNNYTEYEQKVQKLIAATDIWRGVIRTLLPCLLMIFLGAWSDRTGKRKLLILLPVVGEILTSINNLITVYFFYEIPVEMTVFMETIFGSLTGSWVTMFLGVFSYISDITSEETRTFRVGLVNFCMTVGFPVGIGLSGFLLRKMGYYGVFSMTTVMFSLALLYGLFYLKEPNEFLRRKGLPVIPRENDKKVSFFNASHVADTVKVAVRERIGGRRVKVLLTLFAVFILYGPTMSEHGVFYLYVRNKLQWDMVQYGLYTSYSIILHSFGAMFSITVLSRKLQVDDSMLCLISVTSKFIGSIWTAFLVTDLELYLVPIVEILNATTFTSLRSIISKLVDKQENAKVNSLFSLTETLASLMFHPFYSWLYMKTLQVLPGAVFLVSAGLIIPPAGILIFFYVQHRIELGNARKKALEAEEKKEEEVTNCIGFDRILPESLNPYLIKETKEKSSPNILPIDEKTLIDKLEKENTGEKTKL